MELACLYAIRDPGRAHPALRQNWGCDKTSRDGNEFYAETTKTIELVHEIRSSEYRRRLCGFGDLIGGEHG